MDKIVRREAMDEARRLGTMEKWLWLIDQYHPCPVGMVVQFEGTVSAEKWRRALDEVQAAHPLLRARIMESPEGMFSFATDFEDKIELKIRESLETDVWQHEFAEQLSTAFVSSRSPLCKVTLLQGHNQTDLLICFHPSIADAQSAITVLKDLEQALNDEPVPPRPFPADLGSFLCHICPDYQEDTEGDDIRMITYAQTHLRLHKAAEMLPAIKLYHFNRSETASLISCAHEEKATLEGAIGGALLKVSSERRQLRDEPPARILSVSDLHRRFRNTSDVMVAYSIGPVDSLPPYSSLWELARSLAKGFAATRTDEHIVQTASALGLAMQYRSIPDLLSLFGDPITSLYLALSSRDPFHNRSMHTPLRVSSIWGPVLLLDRSVRQPISFGTVDGMLQLLHLTYDEKSTLLEDAVRVLRDACHF